jgi:dinuclear metal center YbgI/SA1388 family protein
MMKNSELESLINEKLNSATFSDYGPNGLQVEGREEVQKIITGVTASQALLDEAVRQNADAVIVHHGYFWKNEAPIIRGMKRNRLKTLLANDINLYGWHLPLDAHPELGNNVQLAQLLGITVMGEIEELLPWGELAMPVPGLELASWIEARLGRRCRFRRASCWRTPARGPACWRPMPSMGQKPWRNYSCLLTKIASRHAARSPSSTSAEKT